MSEELINKIMRFMNERKTEVINIRVSPTVKEYAKKMATKENTSVNEYITALILRDYFENNGI